MVKGRPRHSESQGGIERSNRLVQKRLGAWMRSNNTKDWPVGLPFVMWGINNDTHSGTRKTPYEVRYGQQPRCGLSGLPLTLEMRRNLHTEDQLLDRVPESVRKILTCEALFAPGDFDEDTAVEARVEERREALRTELTPLSVRQLWQRAVAVDVDSASLDEALDNGDPKGTILELIVEKEIDANEALQTLVDSTTATGLVVRHRISIHDRAKTDPSTMLCVVVAQPGAHVYTVATKAGVLQQNINKTYLTTPNPEVNPSSVMLDGVLESYNSGQLKKKLSLREFARSNSLVGGAGRIKCCCRVGDCSSCKCRQAGYKCNSSCACAKHSNCKNKA
eukprot:SAG31_NODE_3839_length_3829_cov_11.012601_2_plen_335_part_00